MTDRDGIALQPGDPVVIDEEVSATVLRCLDDGTYLVQMDKRRRYSVDELQAAARVMDADAVAALRQAEEARAALGIDTQEPLVVSGDRLTFMGDFGE